MVEFSFFFQAEDGMRGLLRSRGLGDVYKRQSQLSSQDSSISTELKLKGKFELAFTPRWDGYRFYKTSPTDSAFYYTTSWYRLQGGIEFLRSQYLHLFVDYFRVRTDDAYKLSLIHI